jgi:hypothetical protein
LKQAGVIIKFAGKLTGQTSAEKGGKVLEELMDEPEEKLKTVVGTTNKWCKRVRGYRGGCVHASMHACVRESEGECKTVCV